MTNLFILANTNGIERQLLEGETIVIVVTLLLCCLYFLPTMVAAGRQHHNATAIFLLNLLLGWTLVGWVCSLVWSATVVNHPARRS